MSKKSERAKELFKLGYNCSQSVLGVFCEELGLDFETAIKVSSSFGAGMGRMREVCGAVSGMFMAAGLILYNGDKAQQYRHVQELAKRFRDKNGSIVCRELLQGIESSTSPNPSERNSEYYKKRPCVELVEDSVIILEEYIKELTLSNI